jgi:hypothetical protein
MYVGMIALSVRNLLLLAVNPLAGDFHFCASIHAPRIYPMAGLCTVPPTQDYSLEQLFGVVAASGTRI